jgi:pyruvate/2-oxoglutarate dehydrogenase complex dihydrolipoamide acyltransferase (E2) component
MTKIILPELGENIKKATITFWFFKIGDRVNQKDDLVELATDKATFNLPSPATGVISEISFEEGDTISVGEVLGTIEDSS